MSFVPNFGKDKVYSWNDKLRFGKYKDRPVSEVLKEDPSYILWALDTVPHFAVSLEVEIHLDQLDLNTKNESDYYGDFIDPYDFTD